jgi:MFS family permease
MGAYLTLLKANRNFRNLWLATVISYTGDWFNLLASAALIAHLTNSGTAISYLFLARFLPLFFLSPFTGVLADRYDRKRILIAADLLRAVTVLCFLLVQITGQVWLLYLLTIIQFSLSALFTPTHAAVIPNIVAPEDLVAANALDGFTWSTMLAVGALLGGIAAAVFGIAASFMIDAASFVLSAWYISQIIGPTRSAEPVSEQRGFLDFVDGLRYLRGRRFILTISLVKAGGALIWGVTDVLQIPLATKIFPLGANGMVTLSIFYAMTGIGSGLGPLIVRRWLGDNQKATMWAVTLGFGLLTLGIFWLGRALSLPEAAAATLLRSLGGGALWVFSSALLQILVEDRFRGRVFAFEFAALTLTQSFATLWAGLAQDQWGLSAQTVLIRASLIGLIVSVLWILFHLGTIYWQRTPIDELHQR